MNIEKIKQIVNDEYPEKEGRIIRVLSDSELEERIEEISNKKKRLEEFYSQAQLKSQANYEKSVLGEYSKSVSEVFVIGGYIDLINEVLPIINELQEKVEYQEVALQEAKEIISCYKVEQDEWKERFLQERRIKHKEYDTAKFKLDLLQGELISALHYIRSCDNATQSAAKAIEMLKKYGI